MASKPTPAPATAAAIELTVGPADAGERLDRLVARAAGVSRRVARIWIGSGRVRVGGQPARILSRKVPGGARLRIEAEPTDPQPPDKALKTPEILYVDKELVVVDKPAGLLSEGDRHGAPSLESLLPQILRGLGAADDIWLVHRLDAITSGVIVIARTAAAASRLGAQFRDGSVDKDYLALCAGDLRRPREVNEPITRDRGSKRRVGKGGKPAATHVAPVARGAGVTLVHARPRTGRTHQIRVHLAHIGHPLLGDGLYGGPRYTDAVPPVAIGRAMLHAARIGFAHPKSGEPLRFATPPPADFAALCEAAGLAVALRDFFG